MHFRLITKLLRDNASQGGTKNEFGLSAEFSADIILLSFAKPF